jgi:glyoxylase-like metal-dependent hydrolase (beta-lactamase superfamily II)
MYELIQVADRTHYIECPAKIGVYEAGGGDVYLIDSGSDKDAGRKVRQILDAKGWTLKAILNTHSNADHIGGNHYLQQQTGCQIFAPGIEADFTRHPILEPAFLYGGYPPAALRKKFLLAKESVVSDIADASFPAEIEIIPLPGHFFDMVGFRTPDGVVFLADCLSSEETLAKYGVPFIYDVGAYLETLDLVSELEAAVFVPSHAPATKDIAPLAEYNQAWVHGIVEQLFEFVGGGGRTFEEILQLVFAHYGLAMTAEQYVLVGSTVRSFLAWLLDTGELSVRFEDSRMLWAVE